VIRALRSHARAALFAVLLSAGLGTAVPVFAQAPPATTAAQDGFVPVSPEDLAQEHLPATPLVFAAYATVWVALLLYVLTLWRRLGRVERDLAEVHAKLEARRR
jgi:CcmD family protein